jgi:hypothetical protein
MKLWVVAEYDYDFRRFVLWDSEPNREAFSASDVAAFEVSEEEGAALLEASKSRDLFDERLAELYTAYAPKNPRTGKTRWGND